MKKHGFMGGAFAEQKTVVQALCIWIILREPLIKLWLMTCILHCVYLPFLQDCVLVSSCLLNLPSKIILSGLLRVKLNV